MKRTQHDTARLIRCLIIMAILPIVAGCSAIGPKKLRTSASEYAQAIRDVEDEQMLTNLVRLRYNEAPMFLQVSGVAASFTISGNAGASVSATGATTGTASVGGAYSESPTITFGLPESREYLGRVMAPVSAAQLSVLAQAGWGFSRVMWLGAKKINRLENIRFYSGTGVIRPDSYKQFVEVIELVEQLDQSSDLDLNHSIYTEPASSSLAEIDSRAIPPAETLGVRFYRIGKDGLPTSEGPFTAIRAHPIVFLRFANRTSESDDVQRLRETLGLNPARYSFPIQNPTTSQNEQLRSSTGAVVPALDPDAQYNDVVVNGRSMLEIMSLVSAAIIAPEEHVNGGIVKNFAGEGLDGYFTIRSSKEPPSNAMVRTKYRGYWFYILDDDLRSRDAFGLLNALFASAVGNVPGANPILTLPVK